MVKVFYFLLFILLISCQSKETNKFRYEIKDVNTSELMHKGHFEMNFTNREWLPWDNQYLLEYLYDTIGNGIIDSAIWGNTGYRKDSNHLYIHPPRAYDLAILEYAAFPIIFFEENKISWKDTFDIPVNSGWGEDLDNSIFYQEYNVVKRNKKEILIKATSIRGKDTSLTEYVYDFEKGFQTMNFLILDSLEVNIEAN